MVHKIEGPGRTPVLLRVSPGAGRAASVWPDRGDGADRRLHHRGRDFTCRRRWRHTGRSRLYRWRYHGGSAGASAAVRRTVAAAAS